jgi:hypothetical protein
MVCLLVKTITTNIWSFLSQCDDNKLANLLINLEAKLNDWLSLSLNVVLNTSHAQIVLAIF